MTQEFAMDNPWADLAAVIVIGCKRKSLRPVGTLTGELKFIDRGKMEHRPEHVVWTFRPDGETVA